MSSTLDRVISRLIATHVRLLACQARLEAATDSEALHDLRTGTRRLRSLLRPLRGLPGIDRLEDAARALGNLTTPLRDQEVLAAHLSQAAQPSETVYPRVADSHELRQLIRLLDAIVPLLRTSASYGVGDKLERTLHKSLAKQWRKLAKAMKDPGHDRHRLRLLIKRVRYGGEAYPEHDPVAKGLAKASRMPRARWAIGMIGCNGCIRPTPKRRWRLTGRSGKRSCAKPKVWPIRPLRGWRAPWQNAESCL